MGPNGFQGTVMAKEGRILHLGDELLRISSNTETKSEECEYLLLMSIHSEHP